MAGDSSIDESKFTGWKKYYNSYTPQGRFNVTVSTYAMLGVGMLIWYMSRRKNRKQKQLMASSVHH